MITQRGELQLPADLIQHLIVVVRIRVGVILQNRLGNLAFPFLNHPAGNQIHLRLGPGEIQVFASVQQRRTGGADMYLFGAALIEKFCGLAQLGSPDDGIVDQQQALVLDQFLNRDQLHVRDLLSLALLCRHEGPGAR